MRSLRRRLEASLRHELSALPCQPLLPAAEIRAAKAAKVKAVIRVGLYLILALTACAIPAATVVPPAPGSTLDSARVYADSVAVVKAKATRDRQSAVLVVMIIAAGFIVLGK